MSTQEEEIEVPAAGAEWGSRPDEAPPRPPKRLGRWLRRLAISAAAGAALGVVAAIAGYFYFARGLPTLDSIRDYRPKGVTRILAADGSEIAAFYEERRTVVPPDQIPDVMIQALLSAEDADFYHHGGFDVFGIARAAFKTLILRRKQGGSTLTQQTAKSFVGAERTFSRKIRELILSRRLEKNFSKTEILWLYLNQVYFGHKRYGVEEAAQFYFGKPARDLKLGEAAMLAGLVQSPERLSPRKHPKAAKERQAYVLRRMAENGFITREEARAEMERPLVLAERSTERPGAYYAEEVRRKLVEMYGEEAVNVGGLTVETPMDPALQAASERALRQGLRDLDRRQGWRGPLARIPAGELEEVRAVLSRELMEAMLPPGAIRVWDLALVRQGAVVGGAAAIARSARFAELLDGDVYGGIVIEVGPKQAKVDLGGATGTLSMEQLRWARPFEPRHWTEPPKEPADVVAVGDVVLVRALSASRNPPLALEQEPKVEGAVVSMDPDSRKVLALVGGYDFARSSFNRATQARRQPGSAFKPFVYAAAIESGKYTSSTIVNDSGEAIRDPWTGKVWKPQNYEKGVFEGPMTLRKALSKSKNTVTVKLLLDLGPEAVIDFARRAGITSPMPANYTLGLGTGEVTLLELVNAYATLAALGRRAAPVMMLRVRDRNGVELWRHEEQSEFPIRAPVAYVATQVMRSVIEEGTGQKAGELGRPTAGKTGTTSDARDAWFVGYVRDLVTGVYVGFDDHSTLGPTESGGRAAVPIWLEVQMVGARTRQRLDWEVPPGVVTVRIDPRTGQLAPEGMLNAPFEHYLEGTEPKEVAPDPALARPEEFFLQDPP